MKRFALSLVLLLAIHASATISWVQTKPVWNCTLGGSGGTFTCVFTSTAAVGAGHLLIVWTYWQSSSVFTASVQDTGTPTTNTFYSAVGPTIQSNGTTPTTAQLFYAKSIHGSTGGDQVTVTYTGPASGSISLAGAMMVEYSGLNSLYPLDSVSAGYSYASGAGTALDSGFAAPANTNLLIFGVGASDNFGSATIGNSNFMDRTDNNGAMSGVCGIAEDFIYSPA